MPPVPSLSFSPMASLSVCRSFSMPIDPNSGRRSDASWDQVRLFQSSQHAEIQETRRENWSNLLSSV
jgi:hypothetical protein